MTRALSHLFFLLALLLVATGCDRQRTIVNDIDERQANEILVFLSGRGIDAKKVQAEATGAAAQREVKWNIQVPEDRHREAMAMLNRAGLPRRRGHQLLEIFEDTGLVPSEMQQKIRYQAGLAEQIASVIRKFDGVLEADVLLSFPEEDPLNPAKTRGEVKASVYVKHQGVLDDPNSFLEPRIKRLVANSIPQLEVDNVSVVPERAQYSDVVLAPAVGSEVPLVNIWGMSIARQSIQRFRVVFATLLLLSFVLLAALAWLFYKLYPILESEGFRQLATLQPLERSRAVEEPVHEEEPEEESEEEDVER